MKISLCLPYMKPELDRDTLMNWCRLADEGPFESLSCGERITGPTLEMRTVLGAAAAWTRRIRIVPSLYVLPMHSAVWAAKEMATLDVISNGRVTVTVGVGGRPSDYQAVGANFSKRHQRMDEQIQIIKNTWAGQPPQLGIDPIGPRPIQENGPPILIGAMGPRAIKRGAQWADGIYAFSMNGIQEEMENMLGQTTSAWQEANRPKPYLAGGFWFSLADNAEQTLKDYVHQYLSVSGEEIATAVASSMTRFNPASVKEGIENMRAAGCEECFMVAASQDICEVERLLEII